METLNSQDNRAPETVGAGAQRGNPSVTPGLISLTCGLVALMIFLGIINVPLALVAIIAGAIGLKSAGKGGGTTLRLMSMIGIACAVMSLILGIWGWAILIGHVPTEGVNNTENINEYIKELNNNGNLQ